MYSFIRPKPKTIIKKLTKVWVAYIILAVVCVLSFNNLLRTQIEGNKKKQAQIEHQTQINDIKIIAMNDYIDRLNYEVKLVKNIEIQNKLSKEGVKNLFDLIPDQITARSIIIKDNELLIQGLTPSKEVYKFLLEAPLRAVFTQSRVEFFPLSSGWYNFVSISKTTTTTKELGSKNVNK